LPTAFAVSGEKIYKIYEAAAINENLDGEYGTVQKNSLKIKVKDGAVLIKSLAPEGKRRMSADEFIRGNNITKFD
jgi:methionyl-tRNA formyltransferase